MTKVTCEATGKRRFRDHREATHVLKNIKNNSTRQVKPCRVYECDACHGWHFTSWPTWGAGQSSG